MWYLKQLLPFTYRTRYTIEVDGRAAEQHFVVWRMWLGRSFQIDDFVIGR